MFIIHTMVQKDENGLYFVIDGKKFYKFSEHFSVSEMFRTNRKEFTEINYSNVSSSVIFNLIRLCSVLEVIRHFLLDTALNVSSGYRCRGLNAAVGGVSNSYHMSGLAADILVPVTSKVKSFLENLRSLGLINEIVVHNTYIHISIPTLSSPNNPPSWKN